MRIRLAALSFAILMTTQAASADYIDAMSSRLGECSLTRYMEIVEEFRAVMKQQKYDYTVEISVPVISAQLDVVYWMGRAPDLATFGDGYSRWLREIAKSGTPEAKVNEKFGKCGQILHRSGHLTR